MTDFASPLRIATLLTAAMTTTLSFAQTPRNNATTPPGVAVAPGYFMNLHARGLNFPTGLTHTPEGMLWVSEAGIPPTEGPAVKVLNQDGEVTLTLTGADLTDEAGALLPPLTDITYHDGWMWLAHLQTGANGWRVGAVSKFSPSDPSGTFTTVITNLPSSGDHTTNEIVFGADGTGYFAQGSATNSGVVGPDNALITGWLPSFPDFRDFPAADIVLNGSTFVSDDPTTPDPNDTAKTAPYFPFDSGPIAPGTLVAGASPSSPQEGMIAGVGAVYSFNPDAGDVGATLQLEAWGLRNPFGIGLDPFDPESLFATNNGADVRGTEGEQRGPVDDFIVLGSRPIARDFDDLVRVRITDPAAFFGWPDWYHDPATGSVLSVADPLFCDARIAPIDCPMPIFDASFAASLDPQPAFAQFELNSSANKFDFAVDPKFKRTGNLFVAETGSFVPTTGAVEFTGYKVVEVDRVTGTITDFIVNLGETGEEIFDPESFNKPIDVKFDGPVMYILDFGVFEPGIGFVQPMTGKLWTVTHGKGPSRSRR